jgi:hypothetical protein
VGGQVADQLGPGPADDLAERRGVGDAELVQPGVLVEAAGPAGGQVIHHDHLVAPGQERVGEMGSDEPGPAGHEYPHV